MYNALYIFDLDNTLINTTAKVVVYEDDKEVARIDSQHYNKIHEIPTIPEHHYDFSEFDSLEKLISEEWVSPEQKQIFKVCTNKNPALTFICTARSNPEMIWQWLRYNNIFIPIQNIVCKFPNEITSQWKYKTVRYLSRITKKLYVWEDDEQFIKKMKLAADQQDTPIIFNCTDLREFT